MKLPKKKSKIVITTVIAGTLAFGGLASAQTAVTTGSVNFRTAPSIDSQVLGTLPKGATVEVIDRLNSYWSKVTYDYNGKTYTGYISNSFYSYVPTSNVQRAVTIGSVNFRTAPSLDSKILGTVPKGDYVNVLDIIDSNWSKVTYEYNSKTYTGYISNRFYKVVEGSSSTTDTSQETIDGKEAITLGSVNFRTAPSLDSKVLGRVPKGDKVIVLEELNRYWSHVVYEYNGKNYYGYISNSYYRYVDGQATNSTNTNTGTTTQAAWEEKADSIISTGLKYWGVEYRLGADYEADGSYLFDCSSYTQQIYGENGIDLLRSSRDQATQGTYVQKSDIRKGDLLFFATQGDYVNGELRIDHVATVKEVKDNGDIVLLHTYRVGEGVTTTTMYADRGYWNDTFLFAKRVIQ